MLTFGTFVALYKKGVVTLSTFYKVYLLLCNENEVSPSRVALNLNISKTSVTRWKQGYQPTDANLQKIADYFGVTVEYLKGEEEQIKKPLSENEERLQEIYNETADLTDAEIIALRAFVAGLKANRKPD